MARTVDDFLARRTRSLILDARAALETAPRVAAGMAGELGRGADWQAEQVERFQEMAQNYLPS
jgi:glycerol-3-phosphate dehydrogenase